MGDDQRERLDEIKVFVEEMSAGVAHRNSFFINCLRASFSKSFEFCQLAYKDGKRKDAFYLISSLRSICEDIIFLAYIAKKMKTKERNKLISLTMQLELHSRIETQSNFFSQFRPDQPVLRPGNLDKDYLENEIRSIWQNHGWPNLTKSHTPNTRQVAEKTGIEVLSILYDYVFRITSGSVHFNPSILLRMGWGTLPQVTFSPRNFAIYYKNYAKIYGILLLCCYFELFPNFIRPDRKVSSTVKDIRMALIGEMRWPEMVTFEEMNINPPAYNDLRRLIFRFVTFHRQKRVLAPPIEPERVVQEAIEMLGLAQPESTTST